jgi:hypothetical protein
VSYQGLAPKANRLRLQPRSADPVNPAEGDIFYSDGTPRAEGIWVYQNSAWLQVANAINAANFRSIITTDTLVPSDDIVVLSGISFTLTLPTAVGVTGKIYKIQHRGTSITQVYTLATTSGQTINGIASGAYVLRTFGEMLELVSNGTNWIILDHRTDGAEIDHGVITIGATTTAPTKGTTVVDKCIGKRAGNIWQGEFRFEQSVAGTAGSGSYLITLPTGIVLDTTYISVTGTATLGLPSASNRVGNGVVFSSAPALGMAAAVYPFSTTQLIVYLQSTGGTAQGNWSSTFFNINLTTSAHLSVSIPVVGWQP